MAGILTIIQTGLILYTGHNHYHLSQIIHGPINPSLLSLIVTIQNSSSQDIIYCFQFHIVGSRGVGFALTCKFLVSVAVCFFIYYM